MMSSGQRFRRTVKRRLPWYPMLPRSSMMVPRTRLPPNTKETREPTRSVGQSDFFDRRAVAIVVPILPRGSVQGGAKIAREHPVEGLGECGARPTPCANRRQVELRRCELARAEVLVSDGIPPFHELIDPAPSPCVPHVDRTYRLPELEPQAIEVRPDCIGRRVASIQSPCPRELGVHRRSHRRSDDRTHHEVNALGVQIAAVSLELRAEQHDVGMVDLLRRPPSASPSAADGGMRGLDLLEPRRALDRPSSKRRRGQKLYPGDQGRCSHDAEAIEVAQR